MVDAGACEADEDLWLRARAGDGRAFTLVFERYIDRVFGHCLSRCTTRADAEELASLVFFEAWRLADRVRLVDGSMLPWLLVVATNLARNQQRARRRHDGLLARASALAPERVAADVSDEVIERHEQSQRGSAVAAALSRLRRPEQEVIALCDLAELTYEAAAQVLDVPVGTVRSRLSRARAKLRVALAGHAPNLTDMENK